MIDQGYINHIAMILDASGSMGGLIGDVVKVFDSQIAYLATRSREVDQETRVSVYAFDDRTDCIVYDKDVLRLPSIQKHYRAGGQTALIDATCKAIDEMKETNQRYGDHAFLLYVLTDGYENASRKTPAALRQMLDTLPDNWTVAVLVPDQNGVFEAKKFGFPQNNIQLWDTSAKGIEEVGRRIKAVTDTYMTQRTTGVRGTRNLFQIDASALNAAPTQLAELNPKEYHLFPVNYVCAIKDFVEQQTSRGYVLGNAFYQLTKPEEIQPHKEIVVRNLACGKLYGGPSARKLLNLPDYSVRVAPDNYSTYEIFVQSTSTNRKLMAGTALLLRL